MLQIAYFCIAKLWPINILIFMIFYIPTTLQKLMLETFTLYRSIQNCLTLILGKSSWQEDLISQFTLMCLEYRFWPFQYGGRAGLITQSRLNLRQVCILAIVHES